MAGFLINSIINRGEYSLHLDGASYIRIRNRNKNGGSTGGKSNPDVNYIGGRSGPVWICVRKAVGCIELAQL